MSGGFPVDLILFAMVAVFLVLRLRGVLGRRQGFERPPQGTAPVPVPAARAPIEELPDLPPATGQGAVHQVVPEARTVVGQTLQRIRQADPGFEPRAFLSGAEGAFRMIVEAFAAGDRETLRNLLSDDTYAGFEQAITARETAGEKQRTEIRSVQETGIDAAELRGSVADITVRLVSDQVNLTTGADGQVVTGAEAVTELTDVWTFQRDLSVKDPTWKLVGTQSA